MSVCSLTRHYFGQSVVTNLKWEEEYWGVEGQEISAIYFELPE